MKRGIPELFVPFLPDTEKTVYSFDEAANKIKESYTFKEVGTYLKNMTLGETTISFNSKEYPANRWAIESLCKICKLSRATTYGLSPYYLVDLINKIVRINQKRVCIFLDKDETKVVNIVKAGYYRAQNLDVISMPILVRAKNAPIVNKIPDDEYNKPAVMGVITISIILGLNLFVT